MKGSMVLVVSIALGLLGGLAPAHAGERATARAAAALRELDRAYVEAWKQEGSARQAAALLPLFTEDAVIMPGGGIEPKQGLDEMREFWFPEGAAPTNVRSFEHVVHGVELGDGLGIVYGRAELAFEFAGTEVAQEGNFLIAARQDEDGNWKIARMIWNNRRLP